MFIFKLYMLLHISVESVDLRYSDTVMNKQTICGVPGSLLTVNVSSRQQEEIREAWPICSRTHTDQ